MENFAATSRSLNLCTNPFLWNQGAPPRPRADHWDLAPRTPVGRVCSDIWEGAGREWDGGRAAAEPKTPKTQSFSWLYV